MVKKKKKRSVEDILALLFAQFVRPLLIVQETDFEEGLKLIRLVEVLSGRSLGRYSRKVTFRHQKLENISLALRFLENEEHIKIVNIGIFLFMI